MRPSQHVFETPVLTIRRMQKNIEVLFLVIHRFVTIQQKLCLEKRH
jgi:hypothetical protein